jgi:hypothetical protein
MHLLKLSEGTAARRRILVYLLDDTDGKTAETGVTVSAGDIKISKNGAAEANHTGTWTEISGGLYHYEYTSGELDTLGFISFRLVKSGVRTFVKEAQVVSIDPYDVTRLGLTALPSQAAESAGGLITRGTGTGQLSVTSGAVILVNVQGIKKNTALNAFEFPMFSGAGDLVTGESITPQRSIDGATFAACANAATEIGTTGVYKIDLAATDLNGDVITFKFTSTNAKPTVVTVKTNQA